MRALILGAILAILITATIITSLVWVAIATWHPGP